MRTAAQVRNRSFFHGVSKQLLKHRSMYDKDCIPFFESLHPNAYNWIMNSSPVVGKLFKAPNGSFPCMRDRIEMAVVAPGESPMSAILALQWLKLVEYRLQHAHHGTLGGCDFTLDVGDVVRHTELNQIGVVAARLPVCFESNEWVERNLGDINDARMGFPWYLILLARHDAMPLDFTRYGSQLSHVRIEKPMSIGLHRHLSTFFKGYDSTRGVYLVRSDERNIPGGSKSPLSFASMPSLEMPVVELMAQERHNVALHE